MLDLYLFAATLSDKRYKTFGRHFLIVDYFPTVAGFPVCYCSLLHSKI